MKKFQAMLCVVLLGALASTAAASSNADSKLDLRIAFDGQRNLILSALQDGETYSEIKPEDKRQVRASLDRIADLLAGSATADSLSEADKVKVFNEQELVNTILTRARADSRVVCTRERRVGSHRTTNVCYTVAERRRMHEETHNALIDNRRVQLPASN